MKSISEVDAEILKMAWKVLERDVADGTRGILVIPERNREFDERGVVQYDLPFGMEKVEPRGTVPQSYLSWSTTRSGIESELQRRGIDPMSI